MKLRNLTPSLIITTYNRSDALLLVLQSVETQTVLPYEVVIADDGSNNKTKDIIRQYEPRSKLKIIHSFQTDKGFRVARSRNLAISLTSSNYIICIDGDMVLDKNFILDHINGAEKNCYLQGSRVLLSKQYTQKLLEIKNFILPKKFSSQHKNIQNGIRNRLMAVLIGHFKNSSYQGIRSCNCSFFKQDFIAVNGFNQEFTSWGREDSEFVARLYNAGIKRKNLKFAGIQYHLFHNIGNSNSVNDAILSNTINNKLTWCKNGFNKH